jgi:hypothetical protein
MPSPDLYRLTAAALAERAEAVDAAGWLDQFAAAPPAVVAALGLASATPKGLAMVRSHVPFSHFNMVLDLGCGAVADEEAFRAIEGFYRAGKSARHWVVVNDHSQPRDLVQRLLARGYVADGAWQRVVAQAPRFDRCALLAQGCEWVDGMNVDEWSGFVMDCYGMPTPIGAWLRSLVGRRGWTHALCRRDGRADGPIAMARSCWHDAAGWAWLGIDAPVPGVMAPCFEDDQRLVAALVGRAAGEGARAFVSDIEVPHPAHDSEAYRRWGELGFEPVYLRHLFAKSGSTGPHGC